MHGHLTGDHRSGTGFPPLMAENLSFGAVGFALIFDICLAIGGNSFPPFTTTSSATGLIGCGPTTVATGSAAAGFSSSETEGLRFRERGGSGTSGYRVENTRRRADQSGRTVRSSLRTGFSIYLGCGGGSDWLLLVVGSYWLSRFLVRDLGCALCLLQGCHEKRGVRINMTNQRVLSFFLYHTLSLSLPLSIRVEKEERMEQQ